MDHDDDLLLGMGIPAADGENPTTISALAAPHQEQEDADGSDDDDSSAEGEGGEQVGSGAAVEQIPDGLNKKEAKKTLSKQQYKLWKKANSSGKKDKKDKKKDKKDKKKSSSKKDKKKSSPARKSGKKRGHDDDDEDVNALLAETGEGEFIPEDGTFDDEDHQARKKSRREKVTNNIKGLVHGEGSNYDSAVTDFTNSLRRPTATASNGKLTAAQKRAQREMAANNIVSKMGEARRMDAAILASKQGHPIHRLMLKDEVLEIASCTDNEEALVKTGFLEEISYWLLDPTVKGLAPLDLREAALRILINVGFKGSMSAVHRKAKRQDKDEIDVYLGVDRDILESARHLGKAVNYIRQNENEQPNHRNKACILMERFGRAWADEPERSSGNSSAAIEYLSKKNAAPYQHVTTEIEAFRKTLNRVDPLDPNSYHRMPPLYLRQTPML